VINNLPVQDGKKPGLGRTVIPEIIKAFGRSHKGVLNQITGEMGVSGFVPGPLVKVVGEIIHPFGELSFVHFVFVPILVLDVYLSGIQIFALKIKTI